MIKVKEVNWYGIKHDEVPKKFEGELTYVRTFQVRGGIYAVYKNANPDRNKGHKDYMMLGQDPLTRQWYVSGISAEDMEKERFQEAVLCAQCDTIIYSIGVHHYHKCGCPNQTMVDGGKAYLRNGGKDRSKVIDIMLDLITGEIVSKQAKPKKAAAKRKPKKK